eukprot:757446-Hanusia_phi.AAC.1
MSHGGGGSGTVTRRLLWQPSAAAGSESPPRPPSSLSCRHGVQPRGCASAARYNRTVLRWAAPGSQRDFSAQFTVPQRGRTAVRQCSLISVRAAVPLRSPGSDL